jgi:hypothetical protein
MTGNANLQNNGMDTTRLTPGKIFFFLIHLNNNFFIIFFIEN